MNKNGRVYPVWIKPPSTISTWGEWPVDIQPILHDWNAGPRARRKTWGDHALSFRRSSMLFKCVDCEDFCEAHSNGAAVLDGEWLCDDCLIERARALKAIEKKVV